MGESDCGVCERERSHHGPLPRGAEQPPDPARATPPTRLDGLAKVKYRKTSRALPSKTSYSRWTFFSSVLLDLIVWKINGGSLHKLKSHLLPNPPFLIVQQRLVERSTDRFFVQILADEHHCVSA